MSYEDEIERDEYGHYPGEETLCDRGCGGYMTWCGCCKVWTHTCCVDYGTCMCS